MEIINKLERQATRMVIRQNETFNLGQIECITGTMSSGKTKRLLERGSRAKNYGDVPVFYFKPEVDKRDSNFIKSRDGEKQEAILFKKS